MLINNRKTLFTFFMFLAFLLFAQNAFAVDEGIIPQIVSKFQQQSNSWYSTIQSTAKVVFLMCFTLEIVWLGIKSAISVADMKDTLQQFVLAVITASLFFAFIENYKAWTNQILSGLMSLAGTLTNMDTPSNDPFNIGMKMIAVMLEQAQALSGISTIPTAIMLLLATLIVFLSFTMLTAKFIVIKCEVLLGTVMALMLVPLGVTQFFKEFALNAIKYIVACAFKLFSIQLIIGVGFAFLNDIDMTNASGGQMETAFVLIGFSIILLAISTTIPDAIAGLISNSSVSSGGNLMATARTIGSMGTAVGVGVGGMGTTIQAARIAKANGAKGVAGVAYGTAKEILSARKEMRMNDPKSMRGLLDSKLEGIKNLNNKENNKENS